MPASTGVGLFQCVQSQAAQRRRCLGAAVFLLGDECQWRGALRAELEMQGSCMGNTPVDK
jgi:hypothetical protein